MKFTQSEHQIQYAIIQILLLKGYLVVRMNSGAITSEYNGKKRFTRFYTICNNGKSSGLSDLIIFNDTTYWFIEIKAKNGKLSDNQKAFFELLKSKNIDPKYFVFDNWQDCLKWVESI